MRKCVYCSSEVPAERAMQICDKCGVGVWGKKQWEHIKKTTDEAQDKGDLNFNSGECLERKRAA
ncbi:Uncharacterised protein [uncultured archaeon]|nr:Uncharacterised protein [uncultured archaeon]